MTDHSDDDLLENPGINYVPTDATPEQHAALLRIQHSLEEAGAHDMFRPFPTVLEIGSLDPAHAHDWDVVIDRAKGETRGTCDCGARVVAPATTEQIAESLEPDVSDYPGRYRG